MRRFSLIAALLSGALLSACLHQHPYLGDGAALGRVVVYRNGVAFYERRAAIVDGKISVHVPRDRVDDFLKSLTVVDPETRRPLSVSIPRKEEDGTLTMTIETADRRRSDVLLTYVTEAPAWKPSYRVVVGPAGKVLLQGWAIVDNVSGEDWDHVLVGVGASSALAFRYDLWSVRHVDRDLLQGDERFAIAPPTAVSPYEQQAPSGASEEIAVLPGDAAQDTVSLTGDHEGSGAIEGVVTDAHSGEALAGVTVVATSPKLAQSQTAITDDNGSYRLSDLPPSTYQVTFYYSDIQIQQSGVKVGADKVSAVYQKLDASRAGGETITIAAKAPVIDPASTTQAITIDKNYVQNIPVPGRTFDGAVQGSASLTPPPPDLSRQLHDAAAQVLQKHEDLRIEAHATSIADATRRANQIRDRLVDEGVPAARIHVVPQVGDGDGVHLLAVPAETPAARPAPAAHPAMPDTPVGESHFMTDRPMTVRSGSSAMVTTVQAETTGGIVYLYDPIGDRGDARYAFKAVRLDNPTADTLEPGPITVYGDGRFIGEGITEPVPPHASVVVPFALDREIVVATDEQDHDRIAKLVTVERGVVTAEVQHRRETHFTVTSRLDRPAKVYLRQRVDSGWTLVDAPPRSLRLGDSRLFEVDLAPGATQEVVITEATPVERTLQLASDDALDLMKTYLDDPDAPPKLRDQISALLATHRAAADLVDKIATLHDQLAEYRSREGELHAQLVTLKAVHTGGSLMAELRDRLAQTSERIQQATLAVVDAQQQLMLLRVKFGNQLADLHLAVL